MAELIKTLNIEKVFFFQFFFSVKLNEENFEKLSFKKKKPHIFLSFLYS